MCQTVGSRVRFADEWGYADYHRFGNVFLSKNCFNEIIWDFNRYRVCLNSALNFDDILLNRIH